MKIFCVVVIAAILAGPAFAQAPSVNLMPEVVNKTPEEKERDAVTDKAYKDSLRKIPDAKGSSDPWGNVRSGDAAKSAAKPAQAKPRTKTGSVAN